MSRFLLRRLIHGVVVVWGVVTVVFFLVRLTGDPAAFLVDQSATREEIEHTRRLLGLDRPLAEQYVAFLLAAPRGDFGDHLSRLGSLLLQSMPGFWLGLLLILLFAVELRGLLPAYGFGTWRHLVLPAVALAAAPLAQNARLVRAGMLEALQQDFVRTARAKGVPERAVLYRHAFKNAAIPFITVTGLSLGFMLSGAIIIETVFAWPGLGRLIVQAVPGRDFPVIQAGVFVFALIFVALNLLVDLLYAVVDPRVRLS